MLDSYCRASGIDVGVYRDQGPDVYLLYGPSSNAISHFVDGLSESTIIIRLYGATAPKRRKNAIDISSVDDVQDVLSGLGTPQEERPRLAVIGAAVASQSQLLVRETDASVQKQLSVNVESYVALARACLPHMISTRYGRFIYLSSFRSHRPTRGTSIYSASKAFGETFFKTVGLEYARFGVTSVIIRMGYFEGGLLDDFTHERVDELKKHVALGRLGQPSDLTAAIKVAMTAEYLNGGSIEVTGGLDD